MDAIEAIKSRSSVREYLDRPISKEIIEKIVDCGRLAPTARKVEPWEFIAITDKELLKKVAGITDHGKFIGSSALTVLVFCKDTKYYLEDGCAATENMLIAATALGVGSCWVAGDKKPYGSMISELFGLPAGYKLVSMAAFGYPKSGITPAKKRNLGGLLHWNVYR